MNDKIVLGKNKITIQSGKKSNVLNSNEKAINEEQQFKSSVTALNSSNSPTIFTKIDLDSVSGEDKKNEGIIKSI